MWFVNLLTFAEVSDLSKGSIYCQSCRIIYKWNRHSLLSSYTVNLKVHWSLCEMWLGLMLPGSEQSQSMFCAGLVACEFCSLCAGSHRVCRSTPFWTNWMTTRVKGRLWQKRWLTRFTVSWWGTARTWRPRGNMWVWHTATSSPIKMTHLTKVNVASSYEMDVAPSRALFFYLVSLKDKIAGWDVHRLSFMSTTFCWWAW